jgi:predicted ATP-dependent endonuclease of OLD family
LEARTEKVATALLWKLTLRFFSIPASTRVFIVEEPEEEMTPLQQVAYVETLKKLAAEIPGENYVVLTTHSPYIAGVSDQPSYYFSYENDRFTCRPATVAPPMTKADALLLVRTIES